MLGLRISPPAFDVAEAQRIARDVYGLGVSAEPLAGERDCNFHLRTADRHEYVLKVFDRACDPEAIDCQIAVLRHLEEQAPELPVPRLLATLAGCDVGGLARGEERFSTVLLRFQPGRILSELSPGLDLSAQVGATVARVDRALQGYFHRGLAQHLAWDVRRLPELVGFGGYLDSPALRGVIESAAAALTRNLPALRALRSQAIHGDCHGGNLLFDPRSRTVSGILDFGDMIHAPMVVDLAVAMAERLIAGVAPPDVGAAVGGFVRERPLHAAEVDQLFGLIAARHAVTLLLHAWRIRHDPSGARVSADAAARAADALARLMQVGPDTLIPAWHAAAGTASGLGVGRTPAVAAAAEPGVAESGAAEPVAAEPGAAEPGAAIDLRRRHRLLGSGAPLFYEQPLRLVRGRGVWLEDGAGHAYLDVYNNVPHVGHTHPAVVDAVQRQTALLTTHTRYLHDGILDYAEQLTATLPAHLDTCIFVNSGSEANDVAWQLAQAITGHAGALVMEHAYHGITHATAALTPASGRPPDPRVMTLEAPPTGLGVDDTLSPGQITAAIDDTARAVAGLAERGVMPAALFLDTAMTSSGIFDPPKEWISAVAAGVRAAGGLIVADEVQYGLGRSGSHLWGFDRRGFTPDIVTLGKPVGNGYPIGVVIANRSMIEMFQGKFGFFSTFGGNPVAAAAGRAVLQVLAREKLMMNALTTGEYLRRRLEGVSARHACLGAVRGSGLLLGLEVNGHDEATAKSRTKRIVNRLAAHHRILIGSEGPRGTVLKLRPPMPFQPEHADLLSAAIDAAAAEIDAQPLTRRSSSGTI